ncbi:protein of unknown function [Sterolibacterium denitrificans]|uniref:Uncharacterized protein n=1 Tax=Sterolibacterium denitrificans TaxID=157592 RepID=A0A7Z7HSM0_9PROT|nr:protein of unknown function [Sterolibacterium denitrificans]
MLNGFFEEVATAILVYQVLRNERF